MSDYIPHHLLPLILNYLPVKTLLRFRCVCKPWKQLISSQSFISDHLSHQTLRPFITRNELFDYLQSDPQHLPLLERIALPEDDFYAESHFAAVSCVHGVVCLYDYDYSDLLFLWNPSIRRILHIPPPNLPSFPLIDGEFKYCGFWIDPSTNHFKIVLFCLHGENASLFSSWKRGWTEVSKAEMGDFMPEDGSAQVLIDGVAHWIASKNWDYGVIVSFDFGRDKLGTIELPGDLNGCAGLGMNVCKWHGALSVVIYETYDSRKCDLWAMESGSWSRMFSCQPPMRFFDALCVLESCGGVLAMTKDRELVLYDPKYRCINVMYERMDIGYPAFVFDFVESLVCPEV